MENKSTKNMTKKEYEDHVFEHSLNTHEMSMSDDHVIAAQGRLIKAMEPVIQSWIEDERSRETPSLDLVKSFINSASGMIYGFADLMSKEGEEEQALFGIVDSISRLAKAHSKK